MDFADNLIEGANALLEETRPATKADVSFVCADAVEYLKSLPSGSLDHVLTQRFLLNLPSPAAQRCVVRDIHRALRPDGRFIMSEASEAGLHALNQVRTAVGLAAIPATSPENLSAIRIQDAEFEAFVCKELGFTLSSRLGFSDYFVMSRVLHPLAVAPERPRFDAPINALSRQVQEHLPFRTGYGSNVIWVLDR